MRMKIGIIGVSGKRVNFGRSILRNILANGFDRKRVTIIKPGSEEIDSVRCVPDLESLEQRLDLFVVAVDATKVPDLVDQVIDLNAAETVMLIPGGLGEKKGSEERARKLVEKISNAHLGEEGGPIFLGGNCLGVVSHPGSYDTLFIPEAKLPKNRGIESQRAAFISQSGAFMITRLSKKPCLDPSYVVSIGNQTDLTLGDFMAYLKDLPDLDVIAVYAEGFNDLDGLEFAKSVREAVVKGKEVVFYKAGRTPEGKTATSGHTASLAGDYMICESCVRQAGAIVAQTFTQFESLFILAERLHEKKINGNRIAAVSGAGFEAVGMADSIYSDDYNIKMAIFEPETVEEVEKILAENRLDTLVDVRNPLDINPAASDEVHTRIVDVLTSDPDVDGVVVGLDPLSPATKTLEGDDHDYPLDSERGIARLMPELAQADEKPIIGVVDGGRRYDPLVEALENRGLSVFRSSDIAVSVFARYVEARLRIGRIRDREAIEE